MAPPLAPHGSKAAQALELDSRRRIFVYVQEHPGAHLREVQRALDLPMGMLEHHLRFLEQAELVSTRKDRYYKRYYSSAVRAGDKAVLNALRQRNPRRIVLHLMLHPGSSHKELLDCLQLGPSTLSFYLKDLLAKAVVRRERQGRRSLFWVVDHEMVARVLIAYRPSFLDAMVDRFLEVWFEASPAAGGPEAAAPQTPTDALEPKG